MKQYRVEIKLKVLTVKVYTLVATDADSAATLAASQNSMWSKMKATILITEIGDIPEVGLPKK